MSEVHVLQRSRIAENLEFQEQLTAALAAHSEWKYRLEKGIESGCPGLEPEKIRKDNQCVFGQWLYSDKTVKYRANIFYEKVRQLHAEFHREAAGVVELCLQGNTDAAKKSLYGRYAEKSNRLADTIRAWLNDFLRTGADAQSQSDSEELRSARLVTKRYARLGCCIGIAAGFGFVFLSLGLIFIQNQWQINLENVAAAHRLTWAQWVVDSAPFVLGMVGYFLGRYWGLNKTEQIRLEKTVAQRTADLLASQREMKMMRDTLSEGVFYLGPDRRLGSEYSAALKDLFEQSDMAGLTLSDIFGGRIDQVTKKELEGYLDLLFDKSHSESMLAPLNPFNPLHLSSSAHLDERFIRVVFRRIYNSQGQIEGLLGVASDITQQVKAEKEAEKQKAAANQQLELIGRILETGPQMLQVFRQQVEHALDEVSGLLQKSSQNDLQKIIDEIYRHIHTVKGSAALLKMDSIARSAHAYEEELARLKRKEDLSASDFLGLSIRHATLTEEIKRLEELLQKIAKFQTTNTGSTNLFNEIFKRAAQAAAEEAGKEIEFVSRGFDKVNIPDKYHQALTNAIIQLIRNSAAHGIEYPDAREKLGKSRRGKILLSVLTKDNTLKVRYQDDGAGIQLQKVKQRAIEKNLITPEQAELLTRSDVYRLLFAPGFSTAENSNMTAGRGVGMDIILQETKSLGGKLSLRSSEGKGTLFVFEFPLAEN